MSSIKPNILTKRWLSPALIRMSAVRPDKVAVFLAAQTLSVNFRQLVELLQQRNVNTVKFVVYRFMPVVKPEM